jgi:hypothetical protein
VPFLVLAAAAEAEDAGPQSWPGRGRLGMEVQPMTSELREFFGAPADYGVLVVRVQEGRPARSAGIQVGDVIVAAGGETLVRPHELVGVVARAPAGAKLVLEVVRKGEVQNIEVAPEGEPATSETLDAWLDGRWGKKRSETSKKLEAIEKRLEAIERSLTDEAPEPGTPPAAEPAPAPAPGDGN